MWAPASEAQPPTHSGWGESSPRTPNVFLNGAGGLALGSRQGGATWALAGPTPSEQVTGTALSGLLLSIRNLEQAP